MDSHEYALLFVGAARAIERAISASDVLPDGMRLTAHRAAMAFYRTVPDNRRRVAFGAAMDAYRCIASAITSE